MTQTPPPVFRLDNATRVTLKSTSPRKEHHGDDLVQAIDLDFSWETHNEQLAMFGVQLLDAFYYRNEQNTAQTRVEGVPETKPNLRNPLLVMPVAWELEDEGRDLTITSAVTKKGKTLKFNACKAKKFKFSMKEGGSVVITWQMQCNQDVQAATLGDVCALEGEPVDVTITGATKKAGSDAAKGDDATK